MKKRLLCIVYEAGNYNVWKKLVEIGADSGEFDVVLWSPYSLPESARYFADALASGTVYVEEATPTGGQADIYSRLSGWFSDKAARLPQDLESQLSGASLRFVSTETSLNAKELFSELPPQERYDVMCAVDRVMRRINFCEDLLVRLGIDAVLLAEDNVERDSYGWIEGARRRGIKTVISSYGSISDQEAVSCYKYSTNHALSTMIASMVRKYLPHWIAEGSDFCIARLPLSEMLAREIACIAPFNPWLVNSGHSNVIALESQVMKKKYRQLGFQSDQLKVIGHPLQDVIASAAHKRKEKRADLCARYNFSIELPLVLVAMPPDQFATRTCEYSGYVDLVTAFACLPSELSNVNVVVSPHPNISEEGRALIRATGAILVETSVADLLPLADLYIASVSSTIKWALGCGVPVIDFDCYGYCYPDYLDLPQVMSVTNEIAYRNALQRFGDVVERDELTALARRSKEDWGEFDGLATNRLVQLVLNE